MPRQNEIGLPLSVAFFKTLFLYYLVFFRTLIGFLKSTAALDLNTFHKCIHLSAKKNNLLYGMWLCAMYSGMCILWWLPCTVYSVLCTVYSVLCTVYSVLCTVYSVLCTVYIILCTVYSEICTVLMEFFTDL